MPSAVLYIKSKENHVKVTKILLRWYKSFNVNYLGYSDRRVGVSSRPWNLLGRSTQNEADFPFIEIPLEDDITTIVGANESGKSHLLSAISKVITGKGIPDGNGRTGEFSRTDLCHYTSQRSKNAEDWPNVGLQFQAVTQADLQAVGKVIEQNALGKTAPPDSYRLTLVLAPDNAGTDAYLFLDTDDKPVGLDAAKLTELRKCLPKVEFIKSELAISDQIPIGVLLAGYGVQSEQTIFDYKAAQEAATLVHSLAFANAEAPLPKEAIMQLFDLKTTLSSARLNGGANSELETLLFRDVLGITPATLRFVAGLDISSRTHADGLTATWNREIDEKLNLAHYWQQDDSFSLQINYKQGVLYFEITDKTGAMYTFKERSSGLRYFLSYYIQAKALESTSRGRNAIVLMDEPDSFLSILGQRNLLSVFESLVRAESSGQSCQLVYTTHSPFLVNRNYPRRLRLVRKGDAEEGTQLVDQAMLRRYEPVRSALGIDCAQTLFMGATNVVVEGPTDQYVLCELIRLFASPENINDLLDLNSVLMVSAESAPSIEKLLAASQWGDEPIPATVVLLDSDAGGNDAKARITGKARNCKKLIDDKFVLQIGNVLGGSSAEPHIFTTEDIFPHELYGAAILRYVERWHPEVQGEKKKKLDAAIGRLEFSANGIVKGTTDLLNNHVHETPKDYDKFGVLQEVVALANESSDEVRPHLSTLKTRLTILCQELRRAVSASQQAARRITGKQAIQRLIDDYFVIHQQSSSVFEIQLLLERIQKDTELLGVDGESLDASLKRLLGELKKTRASGQQRFVGEVWHKWKFTIEAVRKNPLNTTVRIEDGNPIIADPAEVSAAPTVQPVSDDDKATTPATETVVSASVN
jgi:predicted ATPase